jgi:hypothetical protein
MDDPRMRTTRRRSVVALAAALAAAPVSTVLGVPGVTPAPGRWFGLFPAERFVAVEGAKAEGLAPAAGVWHFREEWIAVPAPEREDENETDAADALPPPPPLVWLAAPELIESARLEGDGRLLRRAGGGRPAVLDVVPPLPTNELYVDGSTFEFFGRRPVRIRGTSRSTAEGERFEARTIWPLDARIPWRTLEPEPVTEPESLADLVRAQVPELPAARLLWERPRDGPRDWAGRPVLALVLSGAQADSPGSAGGHIAVATGRLGADGEWADWLVNDVYPVATFGEKGIVSGPVPMDNYLTDLNSGQAMYRPVYVLVAVLGAPAAALDVQATFDEFFPLYWCRAIEYDRATNSSTRLSLDPLRALGWRIPPLGGTSRIKGALAAVVILVATLRPKLAREAWNFFTGERTDIFPRLALEAVAGDLLELVAETPPRPPAGLEARLRAETDGILFLRFPQIPSRRPTGTYPVASIREYRSRVGIGGATRTDADPVPRPLPERLHDDCRSGR